jgi:hypothetical protein
VAVKPRRARFEKGVRPGTFFLLEWLAIFDKSLGDIMISNERPSPFERARGPYQQQRQAMEEEVLLSRDLQVERKTYKLSLRENARGRFIRITEIAAGRQNSLILPASGMEEFARVLAEFVNAPADESVWEPGRSSPGSERLD